MKLLLAGLGLLSVPLLFDRSSEATLPDTAPTLAAPPVQATPIGLLNVRMDFEDVDFGLLQETQDGGAPIDCGTPSSQTACDNASDCEYYGNDPSEDNVTDWTTDYVTLDTTDPSQVARFVNSGPVYLDWWSEAFLNAVCTKESGGPCPGGVSCVDTESCRGAVMWVGKAYVRYWYDNGGQLPIVAEETIQFYNPQQSQWKNSMPRHSPDDISIATWEIGGATSGARVGGAGATCYRVQVYFDRMKAYYVAGFKNLHETCDVSVLIPDWWIRWKLRLP